MAGDRDELRDAAPGLLAVPGVRTVALGFRGEASSGLAFDFPDPVS